MTGFEIAPSIRSFEAFGSAVFATSARMHEDGLANALVPDIAARYAKSIFGIIVADAQRVDVVDGVAIAVLRAVDRTPLRVRKRSFNPSACRWTVVTNAYVEPEGFGPMYHSGHRFTIAPRHSLHRS